MRDNLAKLIGTWKTEGVVVDGGGHDGAKIIGTDTYEWLGETFIVHYADVTFSGAAQKTVEIFEIQPDGVAMTAYNSDGAIEKMRGIFDEQGTFKAGDEKIRTTLTFADNGQEMRAIWEMKAGGEWQRWLEMTFKK